MIKLTTTKVQINSEMDPSNKHTEEYFAARIKALQDHIKHNIPSLDNSPLLQGFLDACNALNAAIDSKKKADDVLANLKKDKDSDPAIIQKAQDLDDACNQAIETMWKCEINAGRLALDELDLASLEASLVECAILVQSTPKGLAEFCANDETNACLVDKFLSNSEWMKLMIRHGGASNGNYGKAILIHTKLLAQIRDSSTEVRHKLALAVALEFATDIPVFHDNDTFIDPIGRFWHYVKAYENKELDDMFEHFTIWELRLIIDGDATDEDYQWGRNYLKAYRPDEVLRSDYKWKYVWAVRSDMNYHHPENDFSNYKELLSAGGKCGPRAWFGRFIAKAWGTPTWGCRQPGHAALTRWTPDGWCTDLGAGFSLSHWTENRYNGGKPSERNGLDFEEETKARMETCPFEYYQKLTLLECLAESMGETIEYIINPDKVWRSLSLVQRRVFAQQETNNHKRELEADLIHSKPKVNNKKEEPFQDISGCFIIPASSCTTPPSKSLLVMPSFLGGDQIHLTCSAYMGLNYEDGPELEYKIPEIIPPGTYILSCHMVNVHEKQVPLQLTIEHPGDSDTFVDVQSINIQYTVGKWQHTKGVRIQLQPDSLLVFSRESPCHGISIKEFILEKS